MRRGSRQPVQLGEMLLACQNQFGRRERVGQLAGLLRDLERIKTGDPNREHDGKPDAEQIDRRQHQRVLAVPRQRQMEKDQHGGARHCEAAERHSQPDRQRGRGNQNRDQKQE